MINQITTDYPTELEHEKLFDHAIESKGFDDVHGHMHESIKFVYM